MGVYRVFARVVLHVTEDVEDVESAEHAKHVFQSKQFANSPWRNNIVDIEVIDVRAP